MKQLVQAGVRVFFYMEDRERTLDSPTDKIMLSLTSFAAEVEREQARLRSRDAAVQRAAAGFVAGGNCFGYRNRRLGNGRVVREIDEKEAAVVRRIFAFCAAGKGQRRIAKTLNDVGAPSPRPQQGRPGGWAPSSVRSVLMRSLYKGQIEWGKSQKRDSWGRIKPSRRAEADWVRVSVPELRIVSDAEWDGAHERLRTSRDNYLRATNGHLQGRPANGVESKYLLTGMAVCGACGAGMLIRSRKHNGKARTFLYGCGANFLRGDRVSRTTWRSR